jgi:hypothetical protein
MSFLLPCGGIKDAFQVGLLTDGHGLPTPRLPISVETVAFCGFICRLQLRGQWRTLTALPGHLARIALVGKQAYEQQPAGSLKELGPPRVGSLSVQFRKQMADAQALKDLLHIPPFIDALTTTGMPATI